MLSSLRSLRVVVLAISFVVAFSLGAAVAFAAETTTVTVTKVDSADASKVLEGATFTLVGKSESGEEVSLTLTTGKDGRAVFENVPGGEYTVEETKAPDGYSLPAEASQKVKVETETKTYTVTIGFYNTGYKGMWVDPTPGGCTCQPPDENGNPTGYNCGCWVDQYTHDDSRCTCPKDMGGVEQWYDGQILWAVEEAVDADGNSISGVEATCGDEHLSYEGERVTQNTQAGEKTVNVSYNGLSFDPVTDTIPAQESYSNKLTTTATQTDAKPAALIFADEAVAEPTPVGSVRVRYVADDGTVLEDWAFVQKDQPEGTAYSTEQKSFEGYTFKEKDPTTADASGKVVADATLNVVYVYTKIAKPSDNPPVAPEAEEQATPAEKKTDQAKQEQPTAKKADQPTASKPAQSQAAAPQKAKTAKTADSYPAGAYILLVFSSGVLSFFAYRRLRA